MGLNESSAGPSILVRRKHERRHAGQKAAGRESVGLRDVVTNRKSRYERCWGGGVRSVDRARLRIRMHRRQTRTGGVVVRGCSKDC